MSRTKPSIARGAWTIAAIFAVAIAVTVGLFLSPRTKSPPVPAGIVQGFPDHPVKMVFVDGSAIGPQPQRLIDAVRRIDPAPQLILLAGVDSSVLSPIIDVFGMQGSFHPQLYQRVKRADGSEGRGVCILAKAPLYAGAPVKTLDGRIVGVLAVAVIDGKSFRVTCMREDVAFVPEGAAPVLNLMVAPADLGRTVARVSPGSAWTLVKQEHPNEPPPATLLILNPPAPSTAPMAESPAGTQAAP